MVGGQNNWCGQAWAVFTVVTAVSGCLGGAAWLVGLLGPSGVFLRTRWHGKGFVEVGSVEAEYCVDSEILSLMTLKTLGLAAEG